MITVNINDAPVQMPRLFEQALAGESIVFCQDNTPVLELKKPIAAPRPMPFLGNPPFPMVIPDDIGDPLPEEIWNMFNGTDDKNGR